MKYCIGFLSIVLFVVGTRADCVDPNSHYVEHTNPCVSLCQSYGQVCPTFAITGPGYECNRGYCRMNGEENCIRIPRNAVYVENTDACGSLCKYAGGCPIRPFAPTPPGFNCVAGYCRRTPDSQCTREICEAR